MEENLGKSKMLDDLIDDHAHDLWKQLGAELLFFLFVYSYDIQLYDM